jgi:hypothetical protein
MTISPLDRSTEDCAPVASWRGTVRAELTGFVSLLPNNKKIAIFAACAMYFYPTPEK